MARFKYEVVAGDIGNRGGRGQMTKPHSVTIHHMGTNGSSNPLSIIRSATAYKGGYMPYHFVVPFTNDDVIYVTQWLNQYTYHNSNYDANRDSIAICLDGNFETQKPRDKQLQKLYQILSDIESKWFFSNGWIAFDSHIDLKKKYIYSGVQVKGLHYHNQVAQPGNATACCGKNLKPYVEGYFNQKPEEPIDPCANVRAKNKELEKTVMTQREQLNTLGKAMKDADVAHKELNLQNAEKNERIGSLEADLVELNEEVKEMSISQKKELQGRDETISDLQKKLEIKENELKLCRASKVDELSVTELVKLLVHKVLRIK